MLLPSAQCSQAETNKAHVKLPWAVLFLLTHALLRGPARGDLPLLLRWFQCLVCGQSQWSGNPGDPPPTQRGNNHPHNHPHHHQQQHLHNGSSQHGNGPEPQGRRYRRQRAIQGRAWSLLIRGPQSLQAQRGAETSWRNSVACQRMAPRCLSTRRALPSLPPPAELLSFQEWLESEEQRPLEAEWAALMVLPMPYPQEIRSLFDRAMGEPSVEWDEPSAADLSASSAAEASAREQEVPPPASSCSIACSR